MRTQLKLKKPETMHFVQPEEKTIVLDKKLKAFLAFKKFIRRNIVYFLIVMAASLLLFRQVYIKTCYYKSEATVSFSGFEMPEYDNSDNDHIPSFAQMKEGFNRLFGMIYSKEMFDHLINKLGLFEHYGLNKNDPSSYVELRRKLKSNISLYQDGNKVLTIHVVDYFSGKMSAAIANEIALKANEMNKNYITSKIENRIKLYSKIHNEIKSKTDEDIKELQPQIDAFNLALKNYKMQSPEVSGAVSGLNSLSGKIDADIQNLVELSKVNSWSLNSINDEVVSNVRLLQDALPGEPNENIPLWVVIPFALLSAFFITLIIFNLIYIYRPYFKLLFLKENGG